MLQYLIILLDDTSTSFCHYDVHRRERKLINLETLHKGIRFAMLENLMIQFVYPIYDIPKEWKDEIETIDHSKIMPSAIVNDDADVIILDDWDFQKAIECGKPTTLRVYKDEFFKRYVEIIPLLESVKNLNVVIIDIDKFGETDFSTYKTILEKISEEIKRMYSQGLFPQLNILTDRIVLNEMNNCNAGDMSVTLAPNGNFYICPAFYYEDETDCIGNLEHGLDIKNKQLYKVAYAPICRHCDAWQCKRCVWLNKKTTLEVNTPSHEQCVVAHIERNASRELLESLKRQGIFLDKVIPEFDYIDPFDKREEW